MTSELHLSILPSPQRSVWNLFTDQAAALAEAGYYLAGGTALALQLGHRQSVDFDFFTQKPGLVASTEAWLQEAPGYRECWPDPN